MRSSNSKQIDEKVREKTVYVGFIGWGSLGACTRVTQKLFYMNAYAVSLVLLAFDDVGSLGSPLNRKAELKPTTFSSLLLLRDFLSFLFP